MKCKICEKEFELIATNKYKVKAASSVMTKAMFGNDKTTVYEAFDCPSCGCQNVVNEVYPKYKEENEC